MCEFYREAVASQAYVELLSRIGFRPAAQGPDLGSASLADLASQITRARVGPHTTYFGSNGYWRADRMRSLGLDGLEDCDAARVARGLGGDIYVLLWRPSEPDRKQRHLVLRTDSSGGSPEAVYVAPGIPLAVLPLEHQDSVRLLLSTEGWPALTDDSPPDPRFQSVYMVDLASRETYEVIRYPLPFEDQNDHPGHLYGHSPFLTGDGRYLFTILYGFEGQGGGMWLADLTRDDFYQTPEAFSRLFPWDHALSWMLLSGPETLREGQSISVILTGKEVADDFAMTVNHLKIRFDGLRSSLVSKERLLRMVGWNPVPFAVQRLPDGESRVFIYTYFNYESSLLDRAKGVFIVSVKK